MQLASHNSFPSDDLDQLIAAHQGRLYGFIRSLMGNQDGAEDVLQNVNRLILEKADDFEAGTNFRAWVFQIARYQVMQFRAKQRREGERVPFSDALAETLAVRAEEKESSFARRQQFLALCLEKLPDRQRDVVERRYFDRESVQSIADDIGLKPNAVSQLLFRSRENLLKCIETQLGDPALKTI